MKDESGTFFILHPSSFILAYMARINLSNIAIVVSRPQFDGNIGSIARAMANMGLTHLRLVAPQAELTSEDALKMACDGRPILESAELFNTLADALADRQLIV